MIEEPRVRGAVPKLQWNKFYRIQSDGGSTYVYYVCTSENTDFTSAKNRTARSLGDQDISYLKTESINDINISEL